MFVRSPALPVAFLPQSDRKVAIWHKWQSFGRKERAEESLEMGLRRQKKRFSTERSRGSSRWMCDWAIFLGFCVRKVGTVLSLWWGKGQMVSEWSEEWTGCNKKSTSFSGNKRSFREKLWGFLSHLRSLFAL